MRFRVALAAVSVVVAACGGRVLDEGPLVGTGSASTATSTPTSSPPSTGAPVPTSVPPSVPTTTPPSKPPVPAGNVVQCGLYDGDAETHLKSFGIAGAVGVYRAVDVAEECSGAGGTHVTLVRVDGCSIARVVHYGEHACNIDAKIGDVFAVGVSPEPGKSQNPGWCVDGLEWDGIARAVRKLGDGETTTAALARYGCTP